VEITSCILGSISIDKVPSQLGKDKKDVNIIELAAMGEDNDEIEMPARKRRKIDDNEGGRLSIQEEEKKGEPMEEDDIHN